MVEQFFETLVTELEHSCLNRESQLHVVWTLKDVNLDISNIFNLFLGVLSFLGGWLFTRVFSLFDKRYVTLQLS